MPLVRVKENEPFDVALRRFKRTIEKTGLLTELRAREFYEKTDCRAQAEEIGCRQAPSQAPAQPDAAQEKILIFSDQSSCGAVRRLAWSVGRRRRHSASFQILRAGHFHGLIAHEYSH